MRRGLTLLPLNTLNMGICYSAMVDMALNQSTPQPFQHAVTLGKKITSAQRMKLNLANLASRIESYLAGLPGLVWILACRGKASARSNVAAPDQDMSLVGADEALDYD